MTEQEELLMLRALVAKQKEELEQKDKTIEQQNIRIENMIQALLHARQKLFGKSTEVTEQIPGQMNLFSTTQDLAKELFHEQKKITVPAHQRTKRQPGVRAEMLASLPKDVDEYIINPEETCSACGGKLKVIGKRLIRTEVEFIPAKLKVVQIVQQRLNLNFFARDPTPVSRAKSGRDLDPPTPKTAENLKS